MRVIELAFVMLVFHGSLAIVNSINPFEAAVFIEQSTTKDAVLASLSGPPEESEGNFAFIQRGMNSVKALLESLGNVLFFGQQVNTLMQQTMGLTLPGPVATLLDAVSGFIYAVAFASLWLKFKVES